MTALSSHALFVLVIEDQEADYDLVVRELHRAGIAAHCQRVETEEEYIAELEETPDIILADYSLLCFSAFRALELLVELAMDIPFIVLTGGVSDEVIVECMKRGAADYLLKDRLARLGPAVRRALDDKDLRQQKRSAEAALHKSKERFQRLVEATKLIPWEVDLQTGRIVYIGPQAVALLGYRLDEWHGGKFLESSIHPDDLQVLRELSQVQNSSPMDYEMTIRMLASDGSTKQLNCMATLTTEDGTKVLRGFMRDVADVRGSRRSFPPGNAAWDKVAG
jgi:PAS domain S-box-containing protein